MTFISLTQASRRLRIDAKTLRHWLSTAHLPVVTHPTDARIKCLSEHHLQEVARLHDRLLPQPGGRIVEPEPHSMSVSANELGPDHLAGLSAASGAAEPALLQKLSGLETRIATLQEQIAGLALALLAEREGTLERRIAALETLKGQPQGRLPSLPEGYMATPMLSPDHPRG